MVYWQLQLLHDAPSIKVFVEKNAQLKIITEGSERFSNAYPFIYYRIYSIWLTHPVWTKPIFYRQIKLSNLCTLNAKILGFPYLLEKSKNFGDMYIHSHCGPNLFGTRFSSESFFSNLTDFSERAFHLLFVHFLFWIRFNN